MDPMAGRLPSVSAGAPRWHGPELVDHVDELDRAWYDPVVLAARRRAHGPDQRRVGPDVRAAGALYRLGMAVANSGAEGSAGEAAVCACLATEATEGRDLADRVVCERVRALATAELTAWLILAPWPGAT